MPPPNRSAEPGGVAGAWLVPAVAVLFVVASVVLWLAGGLATKLSSGGWGHTGFSLGLPLHVYQRGLDALWPDADHTLLLTLVAAFSVVVLVPTMVTALALINRSPRAADPRRSLGNRADLRFMTQTAAAAVARRLRPSLAQRRVGSIPTGDTGVLLGRLSPRGPHLFASWEDVLVAVMAPRAGKTTALAVPTILNAPGAVLATSNKADLWACTSTLRATDTGERVWLFDPQSITHQPQQCWWNPLRGMRTIEDADRLAAAFILTVDDPKKTEIWGPAAQELLSGLLLAAAYSDKTMVDVYAWLAAEKIEPSRILRSHGLDALAASLEGIQHLPAETKGGVFFTARTAFRALRAADITCWVTPPADSAVIELIPEDVAVSRQTVYLLSKDGGGSAAPLVAALTDRVMRAATAAAERRGGRLDPPMAVVLDEAANVCRIGDLPELYSHLGSRGIVPLTILQSYSQGARVWGEEGMRTLWSAATIKIVGSGIDDPRFAEDLSRLVGDHEVPTFSRSAGSGRQPSTSVSSRQQRILPAAEIRTLKKGTALVLATGARPALVATLPWYEGGRSREIAAAAAHAADTLATAATGGRHG